MRTCIYCGFTSRGGSMVQRVPGEWYCKSEVACFNRILVQKNVAESKLKRVIHVGRQMANLCFNFASVATEEQIHPHDRKLMVDLYRQWDMAVRD